MKLPVGYHPFHKDKFLNYQLNRWYSLGYSRKGDIENIGSKINSFDQYIWEFQTASKLAVKEGRLKNAATLFKSK